jgi:hypothetical protein
MMGPVTAPQGTPDAIWWVEDAAHTDYVWYHRNHPACADRWELRRLDQRGNGRYVNMVWKFGDGYRFWTPGAPAGSAAVTDCATLEDAKAALLCASVRHFAKDAVLWMRHPLLARRLERDDLTVEQLRAHWQQVDQAKWRRRCLCVECTRALDIARTRSET